MYTWVGVFNVSQLLFSLALYTKVLKKGVQIIVQRAMGWACSQGLEKRKILAVEEESQTGISLGESDREP